MVSVMILKVGLLALLLAAAVLMFVFLLVRSGPGMNVQEIVAFRDAERAESDAMQDEDEDDFPSERPNQPR